MSSPASLKNEATPYLKSFLLGGLMLGCFQLCMNRIDVFAQHAIDAAKTGLPAAWHAALWMLGLAVVAFVVRLASRWFVFYAGRDLEASLRQRLLFHMHRMDLQSHRALSAGDWINRSNSDLVHVRMMFGFGVMNVVNTVFATVSALQVMLHISIKLTLVSLTILPVLVLCAQLIAGRLFSRSRENQKQLDLLSGVVQNSFSGMRLIRSLGLAAFEQERFSDANRRYAAAQKGLLGLRALMTTMIGILTVIGILLFFGYGAGLLSKGPQAGGISEGGFVAFASALGRMTWPMMALGWVVAIVQRGRASYARIKELFDAPSAIVGGDVVPSSVLRGEIWVRGLTFSMGEQVLLKKIDLHVPARTSCAIVGRTGSGKSTLAWLLARLWPTPAGTVFLDGHDITTLSIDFLRRNVGYAQQEAFLFSTTVARNIGFSLPDAEAPDALQKIEEAAKKAGIWDEMVSLPEGANTVVGERGVQLSGGQRQRVALARALLWDPPVLILDDPMSAVDTKTEAMILQHMASAENGSQRKTRILVTHRVVAARTCDQIVVMDQGEIVEKGSHAELMQKGQRYAAMVQEQTLLEEVERWP